MMPLLDYFLKRPPLQHDDMFHFERLYSSILGREKPIELDYELSAPKWMFLCYLCETKNVVLHGSANPSILEFEPRQSNDVNEFGNRRAVYAASDGIWPMYFAIVNRERISLLLNSCFGIRQENGAATDYYYYFSVDQDALLHDPWRNGTIYILPRDTFEQQEPLQRQGMRLDSTQWASPIAVKPLAKLVVTPDDFPFKQQINGHDPQLIAERSRRNPEGFPWRD
ncbi:MULTISPECIES: hypothetical protein [Paenibacillus]|uniref:hypothetical protein n=1 Tax=Paenibacillus TaxID=44249 RepID=UPI0011AA64A9|nr:MULTISPECIES: hypothetical protein [Paenibacillus]